MSFVFLWDGHTKNLFCEGNINNIFYLFLKLIGKQMPHLYQSKFPIARILPMTHHSPSENYHKFLMKLLPSLPISYGYGYGKKMVKHLMWIMVRKTRPVDICRYYTRKTKICGHKCHKYVQHMLRKQAEQICSEMDKVMQLLL